MDDKTMVRVVTIVVLGAVLLASVVGLTVTAVLTDRELARAEALTFAATLILAALGGVSWRVLRRRHWRVNLERDPPDDDDER